MTDDTTNTSVKNVLESCQEQDERRLIQATKILIEWLESQQHDLHSQQCNQSKPVVVTEES